MNLHLFSPPTALHSGIHRRLERRVCTRAHVVVATRWHEEWIRKVYPGSPGVTRIPNGFEGAEVASVAELRPPQDRLTITHAGMLTQKRSAAPFLLGLKMFLSAVPEARRALVVTFVGPREDRNERAVEELGLAGIVQFRDSLPHEETLRVEKQSHILLLIKHLDPVYRGMVPGKMYEYIGLRRPILALVPPGEAAEQISVLRRGEVVSQSDDKAIARVLGGFYESFRDGSLDENYDLSARPEFDRERLAGDLARLLDRVTGGGRN